MVHFHRHSNEESHSHYDEKTSVKTLYLCLVLNLAFVAIEAIIGWQSNSTGLLSDAGHNLSDALGLLLSLIAICLERTKSRNNRKVSKFVTLANGLLLLMAVVVIVVESIGKIVSPLPVNGNAVILTSLAAIIVNGFTAYLLMKGKSGDINIKAAYLHAATDMLVSVGVVVSGIAILLTGFDIIDPLVSLVITAIIAVPTIKLLIEAAQSINEISLQHGTNREHTC